MAIYLESQLHGSIITTSQSIEVAVIGVYNRTDYWYVRGSLQATYMYTAWSEITAARDRWRSACSACIIVMIEYNVNATEYY